MNKETKTTEMMNVFVKQMLLPKQELALQTMELLADKMELEDRINKATNKIDAMFNNGDEFTIIDDLIELDKILKGNKE